MLIMERFWFIDSRIRARAPLKRLITDGRAVFYCLRVAYVEVRRDDFTPKKRPRARLWPRAVVRIQSDKSNKWTLPADGSYASQCFELVDYLGYQNRFLRHKFGILARVETG
jgi:hypothetical protein